MVLLLLGVMRAAVRRRRDLVPAQRPMLERARAELRLLQRECACLRFAVTLSVRVALVVLVESSAGHTPPPPLRRHREGRRPSACVVEGEISRDGVRSSRAVLPRAPSS